MCALLALTAGTAPAQTPPCGPTQPFLSEILFNPSGTDNGFEALEITGPPGMSLAGYKVLVLEGDGTASAHSAVNGVVDQILDLGAFSLGANGLFLWRDGATTLNSGVPTVYLPGYAPATTVHVADFVPDLENGANTFVLGFGTAPALDADLDVDHNGALDLGALAGFTVVDAVGFADRGGIGALDDVYGAQLGFADVGNADTSGSSFVGGALYRTLTADGCAGAWLGGGVSTAGGPAPFVLGGDVFGFPFGPGASWTLDLGRRNHCVAALTLDNGGVPGQALTIAVAGGPANAIYLTALSFDGANASLPYAGMHAGLVISPLELFDEFSFGAPFVGLLDGAGATSFVVPPLPVLGAQLYGATVLYDVTYGDFVGRTQVAAVSL